MGLAAVACEIVDKSEDEASHPALFQLLLHTMQALNEYELGLRNIIRAFQLQFVSLAGYEPIFDACHFCHKPQVDEMNFFSIEEGAYSCNHCGHMSDSSRRVSGYTIELLRWFLRVPIYNAVQATIPKNIGEEIDAILIDYLRTHIETLSFLNSVDYLKKLQVELSQNS